MNNSILPIIDLDIIVTIILIIVLFMYKSKFNMKDRINKLYVSMIVTIIVILILEVLDKIILTSNSSYFIPATKIINILGFGLSPIVPYLWVRYLFEHFSIDVNLRFMKIPIVINMVISILSYEYGYIFSVIELNTYVRGPLFFIPITITYMYFIINLIIAYKHREDISKPEYSIMLLFGIIPILTATIQILFNDILLIWGSVGIVTIAHYIYLQENLIKYDNLTGIWNRMAFESYFYNNYINKNSKFGLVYVDVNDFKGINDNYGHSEGDLALIDIAKVLKMCFRNIGKVARIGGDEFIIVADIRSKIELENKANSIRLELDELNNRSSKPYKLKVSLGYKIFNNEYSVLSEYVKEIDELMYLDKKRKYISDN